MAVTELILKITTERDELRAEVERLKQSIEHRDTSLGDLAKMVADRDATVLALKLEAERLRKALEQVVLRSEHMCGRGGQRFDGAIDAARAALGEGGKEEQG